MLRDPQSPAIDIASRRNKENEAIKIIAPPSPTRLCILILPQTPSCTYPDPVRTQLKVRDPRELIEPLNARDLIADEVEVGESGETIKVSNGFDLVEGEVEGSL